MFAVQALYMIECVKRGIPLPPRVPPGQFPPVAGTVNISSMMVSPLTYIWDAHATMPGSCSGPFMQYLTYLKCGVPGLSRFLASHARNRCCFWVWSRCPGARSCVQGTPQDIYQSSLVVPPLMPRAVYQAPAAGPAVGPFPSQVGRWSQSCACSPSMND